MVAIKEVETKPIEGQKTGTSGLRKKTKVFTSENYLANWVQSLFNALGSETAGQTLALGGDGRYFSADAAQTIIKLAAGNGFAKVVVGKDALVATPAMSALIRRRKLYGGLLMTASHNPGGPDADFGIKFNYSAGEPAPERITNKIFDETMKISVLKFGDVPDVDLSELGVTFFDGFEVEVTDPASDYVAVLKEVFDFDMLKDFVARPDFKMVYDAMHAVTGPYARRILVAELGAPESCLKDAAPSPDFNGGHPDPNLTYAKELVGIMWGDSAPALGAASDGDGDRNMILGDHFFVTPSDSVAMIAANYEAIPYFKDGLKGVARSMPTSGALDRVAAALKLPCFETPTGWKFFGNLMDAGKCSVCGEESFGTGADHVREKDGPFAVLAWLSILAYKNRGTKPGEKLIGIKDIAMEHWGKYGRNFFSRYDYEEVESDKAAAVMDAVRAVIKANPKGSKLGGFEVETADDFAYTDPIDGSVAKGQGLRFVFTDGSRIIFRLSGTGSSGATIRMYIEQYSSDASQYDMDAQAALSPIIKVALELSQMEKLTGREKPTVIT
uniref:phosphoglucomutase (alpha-D-glucose-1,6-bisphosphate-dependent) n=1 Tax=Chlamydomonas euryale TaxID=1486919 RepID=A0A7R9VRT3_9CHLO